MVWLRSIEWMAGFLNQGPAGAHAFCNVQSFVVLPGGGDVSCHPACSYNNELYPTGSCDNKYKHFNNRTKKLNRNSQDSNHRPCIWEGNKSEDGNKPCHYLVVVLHVLKQYWLSQYFRWEILYLSKVAPTWKRKKLHLFWQSCQEPEFSLQRRY